MNDLIHLKNWHFCEAFKSSYFIMTIKKCDFGQIFLKKAFFYQNYAYWLTYDWKNYELFCGIFKNYTIFNKNDTSTADITEILDNHADYYIWVEKAMNDEENDIYIL